MEPKADNTGGMRSFTEEKMFAPAALHCVVVVPVVVPVDICKDYGF